MTRPPRMSMEDVGEYYLGPRGEVWKLIAYAEQPTVVLRREGDHERIFGAVGALMFDGFKRLRPGDEPTEDGRA